MTVSTFGKAPQALGRAIAITLLACGACVHRPVVLAPDVTIAPIVVHVRPDRDWTDSGLTVHRDDWLFITATGEVFWSARKKAVGPDGVSGYSGWPVEGGGLIGRIDAGTKPFDIGARTAPFHSRNLRSQETYPPPAVRMPADGRLLLGFKDFRSGRNTGEFEVSIRRAK